MSGKVFDELICPECGGRLPGVGTTAAGVRPCTCFQSASAPRRTPLPDEPDPIDLKPLAPRPGPAGQAGATPSDGKKICRVCGKDLTGRSRLKDSKGYICKKCSDAEFAAEDERDRDAIECPECHRRLKPVAFTEYRGTLICRRCHADHVAHDKLKVAQLGELTAHVEQDKQGILRLVIVAAVVLVLGLASKLLFW